MGPRIVALPLTAASTLRLIWYADFFGRYPVEQKQAVRQNPGHFGSGADEARRQRRITQIIDAARKVFQDEGYAGFSARGVAGRVGITLGNLQYYFPTKEELLRLTLSFYLRQMLGEYASVANKSGLSVHLRLLALVERIFDDINETDLPRLLFEVWAFAPRDPYVAELVDEVYAKYCGIFAELLFEADPAVAHEECLARAFILAAQIQGMMIFACSCENSHEDRAEFARAIKRSVLILAGLPVEHADNSASIINFAGEGQNSVVAAGPEWHIDLGRSELDIRKAENEGMSLYEPTMQGERRQIRVDEIVSTAASLLATEGRANFTQARVAKELGTLVSSLQHYFATVDDLLQAAIIKALLTAYHDRYAEIGTRNGKPPMDRLCEIFEGLFEEVCDVRLRRFSFETFALARHSEWTYELVKNMYNKYRSIVADLIREIDTSATARECLTRATLIAAQLEGTMILVSAGKKQPTDILRISKVTRAVVIHIARGGREGADT